MDLAAEGGGEDRRRRPGRLRWIRPGRRGGGGGGRGNFRNFNPGQPHGSIAWNGTNSIFNAQPFALLGQQQNQPSNGTNHFTLSFMSAPYIPRLTKPSGKDTVFLTLSGSRSSTPDDFYATVPTDAERRGDFSAAGLPPIYDPVTGQQFIYNGSAQRDSSYRSCRTVDLPAGDSAPEVLPRAESARGQYHQRIQLPPAHHRAVELHSGRHPLQPQPGRQCHAARRPRRSRRRRRRSGSQTRACARASISTTTGPTLPPTSSISFRTWAARALRTPTPSRPATPSATTASPASRTSTGIAATATP